MLCDLEKIDHTEEAGLSGEGWRDVAQLYLFDGSYFDEARAQRIEAADLTCGRCQNRNGARYLAAHHRLAKSFRELHLA